MRCELSSVMGNRYVKRGERKTAYRVISNFYGRTMSQFLLTGDFHEIDLAKKKNLGFGYSSLSNHNLSRTISRNPYDNEGGVFLECDLEYPSNIQEKTKHLPFCPLKKHLK